MKMRVFSIYDCKAEAFHSPWYMQARGQAIRSFTDLANDKQSDIGKYPADFTLFELGEYDASTGRFDLFDTPHSLGLATEFVTPAI